MRITKTKIYLIIILCLSIFFIAISQAQAADAPATSTAPTVSTTTSSPILPDCYKTGRCSLCDLVQVAVNFGDYLIKLAGALVLLMFVYGGFLMLTAAGKSDQITKGKNAMVNAVIGIIIVLGAYTIVQFVVTTVSGGKFAWNTELKCAQLPE